MSLKSTFFGVQKKWYKLSKLGGGGGNLDKIQKNSNFFFAKPSKTCPKMRMQKNSEHFMSKVIMVILGEICLIKVAPHWLLGPTLETPTRS